MTNINKRIASVVAVLALLSIGSHAPAAERGPKGPFNPEKWPLTLDLTKKVHFISTDGALAQPTPEWTPNLKVLTGADHITEPVTVGGHTGVRVIGIKFNTADDQINRFKH